MPVPEETVFLLEKSIDDEQINWDEISSLSTKKGGNMSLTQPTGKTCQRYRYYKNGRKVSRGTPGAVRRCASFGAGLGQGPLGVNMEALKDTLMTGAIAAGGAYFTNQIVSQIQTATGWDIGVWGRRMLTVGSGLGIAVAINKLTTRTELAYAFAIGPVVSVGLELLGESLAKGGGAGGLSKITAEKIPEETFQPRAAPPKEKEEVPRAGLYTEAAVV